MVSMMKTGDEDEGRRQTLPLALYNYITLCRGPDNRRNFASRKIRKLIFPVQ